MVNFVKFYSKKDLTVTSIIAERPWKALCENWLYNLCILSEEGFWRVWHLGKIFPMDPQYAGLGPKYEWWARVKTPSGQTGWVLMKVNDLPFDRVDRLAS